MNCRKRLLTSLVLCGFWLISLTLKAEAGFLYAMNDSDLSGVQIYGFEVNETTGALTPLAGFPVATGWNGSSNSVHERMAVDKLNKRLYVVSAGSNRVSCYSINTSTGALTLFRTISLPAGLYHSISVHPTGSPLLAADSAGSRIASYNIVGTTATAAAGSPFSMGVVSPFSAGLSSNGHYYYAGGNSLSDGRFVVFSVNQTNGVLTTIAGSPFNSGAAGPAGYRTDSLGRLFLSNPPAGQLRVFNTTGGAPAAVTGNPFASGLTGGSFGLLHPNENFYVVSGRNGNNVGSYRISGTGASTTLTQVSGSPVASGGVFTGSLAFNETGTFLFAVNSSTANITTYSFNTTSGEIANVNVQPVNTLGAFAGITGMAYIASLPPTAASVLIGGRILSPMKKAIGGAQVVLTNLSTQETRITQTNPFGYYRFAEVPVGETYLLTVSSKRYQFSQTQVLTVVAERDDIDFVSDN